MNNQDQAYIKVLEKEYGLSDLEFLGVSEKGVSSYNVILRDSSKTKYFVKQYKQDDAERRVRSNIIEKYICEHSDVPVVLPLVNLAGESHVCIEDKMYAIFKFIEHKDDQDLQPKEILKRMYALANNLGKIHSIVIDKTLLEQVEINKKDTKKNRLQTLENIERYIRNIQSHNDFDTRALKVIQERKDLLQHISSALAKETTISICHHDYHMHNVLFNSESDLIGVIDCDACGLIDPYYDFMNSFQMTVIQGNFDTYQEEKYDIAVSFLTGYINGIAYKFDISKLRDAVSYFNIISVGSSWPLDEHYFMDYTKADPHLESEWKNEKDFYEHSEEIVIFIENIINNLDN